MEQQQFLSLSEAASRLSVSTRSVERAIARGDLQPVKLGRRVLVPSAQLDRLQEKANSTQ